MDDDKRKERKHDVKEFNNLRNQINSLWKEIDLDSNSDIQLLLGKNKEDFIDALGCATDFVSNIADYYDKLAIQDLYDEDCDYHNRRSKLTQKVIKAKKQELDCLADEVNSLIKKPKLSNLFLEVTLRCNAKCEHCGSSCGYTIPKDEISGEELKKALLEVHKKYGAENVFLSVTGGEPLMREDLFDIMEYATNLGFYWGMTTNGMLITEKTIEQFRKTKMYSVSISLDGLKETHERFRKVPNSYEKIMHALDLLKNLDTLTHLQVTTVANMKNINELEDIYKVLLDKGIKEWRVVGVDPIGRASENSEIALGKKEMLYLFNFIREKRLEGKMTIETGCSHYLGLKYENVLRDHGFVCGAGIFVGSILSNGDICVCPNVRRKELVQGNIRTDSFVDVWENKYDQFRKNRLKMKNEKCKKCKSFKYCRGDSFHTWNFDSNEPNMCMKELLQEEFIE